MYADIAYFQTIQLENEKSRTYKWGPGHGYNACHQNKQISVKQLRTRKKYK